jgi:hypothetical protein
MTGNATGRLRRLEDALADRLAAKEGGPAIVVVIPDESWTDEDHARFAAGGEGEADVVEKHTGQRPGSRTTLVVFGTRDDGPQ